MKQREELIKLLSCRRPSNTLAAEELIRNHRSYLAGRLAGTQKESSQRKMEQIVEEIA